MPFVMSRSRKASKTSDRTDETNSTSDVRLSKVESRLQVIYDDKEVLVMTAPNEDELKEILLDLLEERPMNLKELHAHLSGIASEDKIRKALTELTEQQKVALMDDGKYVKLG
ncbi:MAG: hypothetical protein NO110_00925 [Sulfolobales archaeon]|nr:hypothetical protein [Sulfolobales archaeon]